MGADRLEIANDQLLVEISPDKGADICGVRDLKDGIELLFTTPWKGAALAPAPLGIDSKSTWLQRYQGGWQVLCPNAGEEREAYGTRWGYHGEAALVPWRLERATKTAARLSVELFSAPLRLEREMSLDGSRLRVHDRVSNLSPESIEFSWVQHPAFGLPLVDENCRLYSGARTLVTDAEAPGTVLAPDRVFTWPAAEDRAGAAIDLSRFPMPEAPRSIFACLTDFDVAFFAFQNEALGIGAGMTWSLAAFPHAWFWQELRSTGGFPWYKRAHVAAVEPASNLPGEGVVGHRKRGDRSRLGPHNLVEASLDLVVFRQSGAVVGIDPDGTVHTVAVP